MVSTAFGGSSGGSTLRIEFVSFRYRLRPQVTIMTICPSRNVGHHDEMTLWFFAILAALTRALGDFRDPIYALGTAVLVGFLWRYCPAVPQWGRVVNFLFRWSLWLLALGLLRWFAPPLNIALATGIIWAFDRYGPLERRGTARPLVIAGALYTLVWTIFYQLPPFYHWITEFSYAYTELITTALVRPLILGPSASAFDLLLLGICGVFAITWCSQPRRWPNAVLVVVLLEVMRILYIWLAPTLLAYVGQAIPITNTPHLDLPSVYLLGMVAVIALYRRTVTVPVALDVPEHAIDTRQRRTYAIAAAAVLVIAFAIAGLASYTYRPVRVLFLDKNTLDFQVPNFQRFGDRSGGMFGFLATFLKESQYTTYRQDLTPGILDSVDVIIIANLLKKLTPDERQRVWDFIEDGGGLVILGDHTGTDAIRDPTNDLLSPVGLEINFDTAVPMRRSWVNAKSYLFHPLGRSGGIMDAELWLGASVDPGPRGYPIVVGRGAFSDPGDINNRDRSYLGNLAYDPGEPLGDVVLVAAAYWGKGRVILHGDTSPYQNGTIVRSHSLINRSIRWTANTGWTRLLDRSRVWLLALLFVFAGGAFVYLASRWSPMIFAALLLPVVTVSVWKAIPGPRGTDWKGEKYQIAMLDNAHAPMFDGMSWEDKSVGGVEFNFMRNGYSMRFADSPGMIDEYKPDVYTIFAPTQPLSPGTVDRLVRYVENGGWVIVSAGWDLSQNVDELLDRFGLAIRNVPLGETAAEAFGSAFNMADAYPIVGDGPNIEEIASAFGFSTVKLARRGSGGLVAIGDSQFFYGKNLEGQEEFVVRENVDFIRELLRYTAGTIAP
jgi:hypothetical protein